MRIILGRLLAVIITCLVLVACDKEAELTILKAVNFQAAPVVSANTLTLTQAKETETALTVTWAKVEYPVSAPVTYTLQFDVPTDTSGANAWANAINLETGNDVVTKSLSGKELNKIVADLGLLPSQQGNVVVRVKSFLDRAAFSKGVPVKITPYRGIITYPSLWVAGDFQGWNVTTAPRLSSVNNDGYYEGYIYIPAGGTYEFKLYAQPDWAPQSYGDGGNGKLIVANYAGGNFKVPSEGYYLIGVNTKTMTHMLLKTTWGIIGDATPGGWSADTPMTYNPATQTWTVKADMKASGSFKFRANNEWKLNFGVDDNGYIAYADHPLLPYVNRSAFAVQQDGNYSITMDLHEPGNYTYSIKRN